MLWIVTIKYTRNDGRAHHIPLLKLLSFKQLAQSIQIILILLESLAAPPLRDLAQRHQLFADRPHLRSYPTVQDCPRTQAYPHCWASVAAIAVRR